MDTILTRFQQLKEYYTQFESFQNISAQTLTSAFILANSLKTTIASQALFSSNQILQDLPTQHIPFMLVSFYQGLNLLKNQDQEKRFQSLQFAEGCLQEFLSYLDTYRVIPEGFKRIQDPTRDQKIAEARKIKEIQSKIELLQSRGDQNELRKLYKKRLKVAAYKSVNQLRFIQLEKQMLQMRKNPPLPPQNVNRKPEILKIDQSNLHLIPSVISNSADLAQARQKIQAQVFQPGHILPTMTVEQYGEWQMQLMQEQGPPPSQPPEEPDSDDQEEGEAKRKKASQWDDWKDAHEKGAGNRMRQLKVL